MFARGKLRDRPLVKFPFSLVTMVATKSFSPRDIALEILTIYEKFFFPIGFSLALSMTIVSLLGFLWLANASAISSIALLAWVSPLWVNYVFRKRALERKKMCYQILLLEEFLNNALMFCATVFAFVFIVILLAINITQTLNTVFPDFGIIGISAGAIFAYGWLLSGISIVPIFLCQPQLSRSYKAELTFRLIAGFSKNAQRSQRITRKQLKWLLKWFQKGLRPVNALLWYSSRRPQIDIQLLEDKLASTLQFETSYLARQRIFVGLQSLCLSVKQHDFVRLVSELGRAFSLERREYLQMRRSSLASSYAFVKLHAPIISIAMTIVIFIITQVWRI